MKRIIAGILRVLSWNGLSWAERLYPLPVVVPPPPPPPPPPVLTVKEVSHAKWVLANGDKTLRLNYSLKKEDVVLDVGGFEGQWASDIFGMYLCEIHIFEPVPHFSELIRRRFLGNHRIVLHDYAVGMEDGNLQMTIAGDASSSLISAEQYVEVSVKRFSDVVRDYAWDDIALMKVNIEGGEYDLLEHLLDEGLIGRIRNLQIQFHDFVPNARSRMEMIQSRLRETHEQTYDFPFIWENWRRRGLTS